MGNQNFTIFARGLIAHTRADEFWPPSGGENFHTICADHIWALPSEQILAPARASRRYLILAKHSFRRSSSKRTCDSMAVCSAAVPLLENSAEAFLSRFCFQSRIASLVAFWASDAAGPPTPP